MNIEQLLVVLLTLQMILMWRANSRLEDRVAFLEFLVPGTDDQPTEHLPESEDDLDEDYGLAS